MGLAFDLLLTLLIELPIVALFFKRRKRSKALMYGLLVNLVSWPVMHILKLSAGVNIYLIEIIVITGEAIGLWLLMECGWKKGFLMAVIANCLSFAATNFIHFDTEILSDKPRMIVH
jgi:hypothetical protein